MGLDPITTKYKKKHKMGPFAPVSLRSSIYSKFRFKAYSSDRITRKGIVWALVSHQENARTGNGIQMYSRIVELENDKQITDLALFDNEIKW